MIHSPTSHEDAIVCIANLMKLDTYTPRFISYRVVVAGRRAKPIIPLFSTTTHDSLQEHDLREQWVSTKSREVETTASVDIHIHNRFAGAASHRVLG